MLLKSMKRTLALVTLLLGVVSVSCTDDAPKAEEPVKAASTADQAPAAESFAAKAVYFGFDDYTLTGEAQSSLQGLGEHLKANQGAVVQVEGHCDERGSIEYNLALGERRAQSVKNYLVQLGVDAARLSTISYGEEKPAVEGHDEAAWAKNRRAEFTVTKK